MYIFGKIKIDDLYESTDNSWSRVKLTDTCSGHILCRNQKEQTKIFAIQKKIKPIFLRFSTINIYVYSFLLSSGIIKINTYLSYNEKVHLLN